MSDRQDIEGGAEDELRRTIAGEGDPSGEHDERILAAARASAERIRSRNAKPARQWYVPASIAASFLLGLSVALFTGDRGDDPVSMQAGGLRIPAVVVTRDDSGARETIAVEEADPEFWLRHIQELFFTGRYEEAEEHLERFNELYPNYVAP